MKFFLLVLFVAVSTANPIPDDDNSGRSVDVVVNGVPEGEPLDISNIVDIKVQQHVDGVLTSAVNALHPYSAAGIAEAALAAADIAVPDVDLIAPEPVLMPSPAVPEVVPSPEVIPSPVVVVPEAIVPEPVVLPQPAVPEVVLPEPVVIPEAVQPEVVPEAVEEIPVPSPQIPQGEVYNDGTVQISVNIPQEDGVIATLQSWLSVVFNYFGNDSQTTQQIV